jgi:hypothetical protein
MLKVEKNCKVKGYVWIFHLIYIFWRLKEIKSSLSLRVHFVSTFCVNLPTFLCKNATMVTFNMNNFNFQTVFSSSILDCSHSKHNYQTKNSGLN